jgi:hypothetical protein
MPRHIYACMHTTMNLGRDLFRDQLTEAMDQYRHRAIGMSIMDKSRNKFERNMSYMSRAAAEPQ